MPFLYSNRRKKHIIARLPLFLNFALIFLGIFTLIAMSAVIGIFEEFTAFTDYTQQWIEFNFFIHYWDKLTIARVYLWFIFIYGAVILAISSLQIHGLRKKNLNLLHLAPLLLIAVAIVTVLGAICWLIVTAVNYNEGFLATGGFIFERMRFKGNVWKDLIYREQSWRVVTENRVPIKAPILKIWVHQRERDFECCGWDGYMDYAKSNLTDLPESCCQRKYRVYGCGDSFKVIDRSSILNTRGCRNVMYPWYRQGFIANIIMSIIGIGIGAYQFYLYSVNRKEYFKLLDEYDDMRKPMMNTTMSMSTINSKASVHGGGHLINFGQTPSKYPMRIMNQQNTPSIGGGSAMERLPEVAYASNNSQYSNPLQNVQNMSGRFSRPRTNNSVPSDRIQIAEDQYDQNQI